jgi:uncharacterized protein (TIGR03083 family)
VHLLILLPHRGYVRLATMSSLVRTSQAEGQALLAAARTGWHRPVPDCPDWDVAALVRHVGGILGWMAEIVTTHERVSPRSLPPPPEPVDEIPDWFEARLARTVAVFESADPNAATWTFSSIGDHRAGWWDRRLAVEIGVHRYDAENAVWAPAPLDGEVAAAGIAEFMLEFLPGLLAQADVEGLGGTLHLHATDGDVEWFVDLDARTARPEHRRADTAVRASRSDLLLWLTNRAPLGKLEVLGDASVGAKWARLRR